MRRYHDGDKLLEDVIRALEEALGKHGVEVYSLLGVTTVLEAIASPLKLQRLQGKAGRDMGRLGHLAYYASTIPRRVALLQNPHSETVNPMMECIVVALQRARAPIEDTTLRMATYRIFLSKPRATIRSAEKENSALSPAFSSARDHLIEARVIGRNEEGVSRLNELWEMT